MPLSTLRRSAVALAGSALCCGFALPASADAADPMNELRLGGETIFYHAVADDLTGPYVPAGVNFHFVNYQAIYWAYVRSLNDNFLIEVAGGYPPLLKTDGQGPARLGSVAYNGQPISTARIVAPTAFLEYEFGTAEWKLRPFVGVGINYTNFYDRRSTGEGDAASGGPTKISLPASFGPAATAGLSYRFAERWHAYASYSLVKVDTRLTAVTGDVERTSHIEFHPQVLTVSVGYSF
jgi:outer membrane protein